MGYTQVSGLSYGGRGSLADKYGHGRKPLSGRWSDEWFQCALRAEARGDHDKAAFWMQLAVADEAKEVSAKA